MKKIISIAVSLFLLNAAANAQTSQVTKLFTINNSIVGNQPLITQIMFAPITDTMPAKDHDFYLIKSKNQKKTGRILLYSGAGLISVGLLIGTPRNASFGQAGFGAVVGGIGALLAIGSIPAFISSGNNKRKAMVVVREQPSPAGLPIAVSKNITGLTISIPIGK